MYPITTPQMPTLHDRQAASRYRAKHRRSQAPLIPSPEHHLGLALRFPTPAPRLIPISQ